MYQNYKENGNQKYISIVLITKRKNQYVKERV